MSKVFNYRKFYLELNRHRRMRGITWNKVSTRAGIAPSGVNAFIRHYEDPTSPPSRGLSLEYVVKLLDWMNKTDLAPFLADEDDPDVLV